MPPDYPDGRIPPKTIRRKRRTQREPVSLALKGRDIIKPIKSRRRFRPVNSPADILEDRATQSVPGSILERVVYAELVRQLGPAGFIYKHLGLGGRLFRGGVEMDFLVVSRHPNIAIEVQGTYWHGPSVQYKDAARAMTVRGLLGEDGLPIRYEEIMEEEIRRDPLWLEQRIRYLLGHSGDINLSLVSVGSVGAI